MSRNRTISESKKKRKLQKGPNGRNLCRWCSTEVKPPRITFCDDDCVHEWKIRSDPNYLRSVVFDRDQGICAKCGSDTVELKEELRILRASLWKGRNQDPPPPGESSYWSGWKNDAFETRCDELKLPKQLRSLTSSLWHADHIVPVAEGGGECGIDNIQTLCVPCHNEKTAEQRRRKKT